MKIIRHSRKMSVYSLSLLLSTQQVSCMQHNAPAAHPDEKSIGQLSTMLREHNNVDRLIDTYQRAIGAMEDHDETVHHMLTITLPARGRKSAETKTFTHEELAEFLCAKQDQRQIYDDAFWFSWDPYWEKDYNKQLVRSNFITTTTFAYSKRCEDFKPDTTIIDNLPKSAQQLDSLAIVEHLQNGFSTIDHTKKCLSMTVGEICSKLATIFHFFDNPPICCWYKSENAQKLEHNVFLRSHVTSFVYFIAKQKRLKALTLSKPMPAAPQEPQQPQQQQQQSAHPYASPSIIIIGGHPSQPPPYNAQPHYLSQIADPFVTGTKSGLGDPNNQNPNN